jgi:hypothetical protein
MTFDYAGACLAKPTPSPAPTDNDISPGAIFLIVYVGKTSSFENKCF